MNTFCEEAVNGAVTREVCCQSALGKGWGSPCEKCPTLSKILGYPTFRMLSKYVDV